MWIELFNALHALGMVLLGLMQTLLPWLPGGLWCAWFLWGVNWKRAWPMLTGGGWLPVVLLVGTSALVWSQIFPTTCRCLGVAIPNFWWQLGACSALVVVALFCGWVQEQLNWAPAEVSFDPPASEHGHGHDHGHGHH